ncbi:midasin-like isoform X2 [Sitophilus oryzae]|uniref:Midasin n=1 Tax=Sitophilus oryzae TaxID=7048 RepID=A0A6J2X9G0_SITOR|nr:midasin-like isoform X2 [Sitophilus oryzae]
MADNTLLYSKLKEFSKINEQFSVSFKIINSRKNLSGEERSHSLLDYIAREIFTVPQYFLSVTETFRSELPLLVVKALHFDEKCPFNFPRHVINSILLSKIVQIRPDIISHVLQYFESYPSPFDEDTKWSSKRTKLSPTENLIRDIDIVKACYYLLRCDPKFFRQKWMWSIFLKRYLFHKDYEVSWLAHHVMGIVLGMNETTLQSIILKNIPEECNVKFTVEFNSKSNSTQSSNDIPTLNQQPIIHKSPNTPKDVVNVAGVYISASNRPKKDLLLEVSSTLNNLRKIAVGLSSNKALCLQGPVGSGKTALIEHLAAKTGKKLGEDFIKIQLGDQTDSKMLLGTYRCTDIPGEFLWQPGVLTQAVIDGSWLLMEDIDLANMDIASVLTSLLENSALSVPGYRDLVPVKPGFKLIVTQRLIPTLTGYHKKHSGPLSLLDKQLLQIFIDPLTSDELKYILHAHYPKFDTISDRLINVFKLFSSESINILPTKKSGRLISTRDFFKWCSRAIIDYDVKSQESALKILQDAMDVFCCWIPDEKLSLNLSKEISAHLGIVEQKAEYFYKNYKPTMQLSSNSLTAGRASLSRDHTMYSRKDRLCFTRPASVMLERIMCCVKLKEPVLLVGETGTGKTSSVQFLASSLGKKLVVINMNQQSDSADLLGGFKPVDLKLIITPIKNEFYELFSDFFKIEPNKLYLSKIDFAFNNQRFKELVRLMQTSTVAAVRRLNEKMKESLDEGRLDKEKELLNRWENVRDKLRKLEIQVKQANALSFAFIEGSLVKAVQEGSWVLLDEINLANAETLECLSGLLEGNEGSLCLVERGDKKPIQRHPNFTLFACMNPATNVGKKDLPMGLRNRFTEFYVDELTEKSDLMLLVNSYLQALALKENEISRIVQFYLHIRAEMQTTLCDGLGHKPHFSLRSLCRALIIASKNPCGNFKRSLYEAFCLSFLTQLDSDSYRTVETMIAKYMIGDFKALKAVLRQPIPEPVEKGSKYLQFEGYWIKKGCLEANVPDDYILTESVRKNLKDLARIVSIGKLPVLLQGDTSVGKTSLIMYLAKSSGNKCVRINNHEHTDLQEYIGSYVANSTGKLVFREGVLVEAMRKGHWIILDELNLAPTDVLEALNRVLDDNRELFIPETQETVKADENFMLFATQNPPGTYGGRKTLSRAFRNRFVELHFNEIPPTELEVILHKRCAMPPSYAKRMISVMTDLQVRRRTSAAFAGKQGFITLRDLFRWGERYRLAQNTDKLHDWNQHLTDEGYLVLAGKVRKDDEKNEIVAALQKHWQRKVVIDNLFTLHEHTSSVTKHVLRKLETNSIKYPHIVWTLNMRKLAVLVAKAIEFNEPVLLIGETGGGKTTICQLIAENNGQELVSINCHMNTESSDFIGGLRPVREHSQENRLFEWIDGPLINAMRQGSVFLADEISLADDSVLERLNSLLEPERTLLLAEKGIDINNFNNSESITAHPSFCFIGTMNPGGDFGKKELSPALRNRFTEIWCDSHNSDEDLKKIIEKNLDLQDQFDFGSKITRFIEWFRGTEIGKRYTVSIRDILTWVNFINTVSQKISPLEAYFHGAYLVFLDSLGSGTTSTESLNVLQKFKQKCGEFLKKQIESNKNRILPENHEITLSDTEFGIKPFCIGLGGEKIQMEEFSFDAPTTMENTLSLLRGMQLNKAILLEGSPGVGKTSLVTALAKYTRHKIFRINLSDQTDVSDLFGADLPVEGGTGGQFSWRDGPFLQALKEGCWILLDELNLASQSVLEGLNACLDHRGEIFIPELGKTFHVKTGTRFFACQNPVKQGGSRRGLPKSFLNRFIQVYVTPFSSKDMEIILTKQFPNIPKNIIQKMIEFNYKLSGELSKYSFGTKGAPWECNLRDLTRWCEAILYHYNHNSTSNTKYFSPESTIQLIYIDRMRSESDKTRVREIFVEVFGCDIKGSQPVSYVNRGRVYFGDSSIDRSKTGPNEHVLEDREYLILRNQLGVLRSLSYCVNQNWLAILVGSSGVGKSSVVKTLANLAGKTLRTLPVTSAMDTTDILGGFEQTNYSRHLEEIAREAQKQTLAAVQHLLIDEKVTKASQLLEFWEEYLSINESKTNTMDEEVQFFLNKTTKLEKLLKELYMKCNSSSEGADILQLLERCTKIFNTVNNDKSLSAGGRFEWVNSILVKCLQEGDWLLVDNVNLCSAAVLDRLNSLLEPRGVLTVSERGTDDNGSLYEVRPHKDFRIFFTMDPKNGEISRAMRNRGVEIYMLQDFEPTDNLNNFDLKSLIHHEGLTNPKHLSFLIKIHEFISTLILSDKPTHLDILRCSSLISSQISQGISLTEAFCSTCIEIYYKTRSSSEFNCNNVLEVIQESINRCLNENLDNQDDLFSENVTMSTKNLPRWSEYEKTKHEVSLCVKTLEGFDKNTKNAVKNMKTRTETKTSYILGNTKILSKKDQLKSAKDLSIWSDLENTKLHNQIFEEINFYKVTNLLVSSFTLTGKDNIDYKTLYLKNLISQQEWHSIFERFSKISKFFDDKIGALPLDSRWINTDLQINENSIFEAVNYSFQVEIHKLRDSFELKHSGKNSIYQYLVASKKKTVPDIFKNAICTNYLTLRQEFLVYMRQLFVGFINNSQSEETFIKILELLTWRQALHTFLTCTGIPESGIKDPRSLSGKMDSLNLYYRWFYKYSVKEVSNSLGMSVTDTLNDIFSVINEEIDQNFTVCHKISRNFKKFNDIPDCLKHEWQLTAIQILDSYTDSDHVNILSYFINNNSQREELMKLKKEVYLGEEKSDLTNLKAFDVKEKSVLNLYEMQMIPLADCLVQIALLRVIQGDSFQCNNVLVPIDLNALLLIYNETGDRRLIHEVRRSFYSNALQSASVKYGKFFNEDEAKNVFLSVAGICPTLLYLHNKLFVRLNEDPVTLYNYKDVQYQRRYFSCLIWKNIYGFSDVQNDFVSLQQQLLQDATRSFFHKLKHALSINTHEQNITEIISQISDKNLQEHSRQISNTYNQLTPDESDDVNICHIADLHVLLGFTEAYLNSMLPNVDPVAKKAMKKNHIHSIINMLNQMGQSFELQNSLISNYKECIHPYYKAIKNRVKELEQKCEKYGENVTSGVKLYPYSYVIQQIKHAFNSVINEKLLKAILETNSLVNQLQKLSSMDKNLIVQTNNHVERLQTYLPSLERIFHELKMYRTSYPDILEPLLANIAQLRYGFNLKLYYVKRELVKYQHRVQSNIDLEKELVELLEVPCLNEKIKNFDEYIDSYSNGKINSSLDYILNHTESFIREKEKLRLLLCGIQEYYNLNIIKAKNSGVLDKESVNKFNELIRVFINLWNRQQEKEEKEQNEAENIYKIRTKCEDKSEEEQIDEELNDIFKNYHSLDFADLQTKPLEEDSTNKNIENVNIDSKIITENDIQFVINLHSMLLNDFVETEWINVELKQTPLPNLLMPLTVKFKLARLITDSYSSSFKYTTDSSLVSSLSVLVESSGSDRSQGVGNLSTKAISGDFYRDSNVEEVKGCHHVLIELKEKINELLVDWPDQPTLNTILTVIDRILHFDISSPISRFLTGFDILLEKCHEWEQVAHSGVSLIHFSPNLVQQIIGWRKTELNRWKDLLNSTFEDMKKPLKKWWIYVYNLMNQYVLEEKVSESELVDILQKFITKSTLVEFEGRLSILYTFHLHAVYLTKTKYTESFINILWNVYNYYKQFSSTILQKIKDLRTPIEKKLKDYVKIVKWKDVSYWSIKETVDKSHKTLHKFVREYKEVLLQPVVSYLCNPTSTDISMETVGIWDRPQRQNPKSYHYTLDADSYLIKSPGKDIPYVTTARKISKETILATEYPELVKSLDGFVTDVIETSSHLRNLEVDSTLPKEKQVSQAKSILQQKHRALTELFQNLSKMGLSYKRGILNTKLKKSTECFTIKPINLSASFAHLVHNRLDEKILTIWDSCELYYYKCLTRYDLLEMALVNPAKDLGMQNIERCRGFAAEFLTYCQEQKEGLIKTTRSYYYLRNYSKKLHEICQNPDYVPVESITRIKNTLDSLTVVISQIKLVLNSCPTEETLDHQIIEIPVLQTKFRKIQYKNDDFWIKSMKNIDDINSAVSKIANHLQKIESYIPSTDCSVINLKYLPHNNRTQLIQHLGQLNNSLIDLKEQLYPVKITRSLDWIIELLAQIIEENNSENAIEESEISYETQIKNFTDSILISLQNLYKKYRDLPKKPEENLENDEEENIKENHLKVLIAKNLSQDVDMLDLKKILLESEEMVKFLLGGFKYASEQTRSSISHCIPLLDQVLQLSQYFITQQVCTYRTTCKLTSVVLSIFNDLASKGFCVPPDLEGEMDKEGVSKPSDGLGLGEGQGERDVSDRIESEDQLDDAQPAGQEKETSEDPDCKEEDKGIEMSEDFDSKLQDKKQDDEDNDDESDNSDAEEQMGETEKGADGVDQEIWGDKDENQEEDSEEQKEDDGKGGEKDGEDQLGAKDEETKDKSKQDKEKSKEQNNEAENPKEEINEMKEPEYNDEQIDPYHGNQPELPEPEAMDLPDDLQLDEGEEQDGEKPEDNPFDIDEMKELNEDQLDKPTEVPQNDKQNDEVEEFSSDDEDGPNKNEDNLEQGPEEDKENEEATNDEEKDRNDVSEALENEDDEDNKVENEESGLDENVTNQENVEAMEVDDAPATDKTQATNSENIKSNEPIDELCQEDKPDKEGVGQSQMEENETGHSVQTTAPQQVQGAGSEDEVKQKKEKPGISDSKRSLGDVTQPVQKKLKTIDTQSNSTNKDEMEDNTAEMYEHIENATEKSTTQVLDAATKEQAEEQNKAIEHGEDPEEPEETEDTSDLPKEDEKMDTDLAETQTEAPMKTDNNKEKNKTKKQHPEGEIMEDLKDIEIEGEIIQTSMAPRGNESFHHTQYDSLKENFYTKLTQEEMNAVRTEVEQQLSSWTTAPVCAEAELAWQRISSVTNSLAQDLSEQLRLVLEPTKASHLKGDFRTGRRINMRKIIPYIASQFRKDKIWLRRTKPSKREYQIVLAIDDSSSMADNHSKELAFESVALISKALSLLESGQLSVVGFGERTEVHHKLTDPFTETSGVNLLQKFQFDQTKTLIGRLLHFVTEMFEQSTVQTSVQNAKLLLIVSDGRGVFSEGESYVTQAVRKARLSNIFTVCVIVDSPENQKSIFDIRSSIFKEGQFCGFRDYMDAFPFPFYIILRDINTLPSVLSDALMQWFEMITSQ